MENNSSKEDARVELDSVEAELELLELQISELLEKQAALNSRRAQLLKTLEEACESAQSTSSSSSSKTSKSALSKQELQYYEDSEFLWSKEVQEKLGKVFKLTKFRPLQLLAINLSMAGRDLFLVMPTGRGKSLCYQLPAICSQGFTLVIAPLVSLMEDQLMCLESIGVPAVTLNASSTKEHSRLVMTGMIDKNSPFKLLYVTPEKIAKSKLLMSKLEKAYNMGLLARIAVDEVHCCSQWGHDFRPDYKLLGILKRQFPRVPLIGLTATATSQVLKDCQKILCIKEPVTLTAPFNRPNLYYEVRCKDANSEDSVGEIASLIKGRYKDQSGIVYVFSQKDAEVVAMDLQKRGICAQPYHANMGASDKTLVHQRWSSKKIQVVVATVAFGMGIDKADVRFVIHHSISKSIENYYQESGRAGRDDAPADCIVFYGFADIFRISTMVVMENTGQQKLYNMVTYCQNVDRCRRSLMAVHFDEVWDDDECNQMCDVCRHGSDYITVDITQHARDVVQIVEIASSLDEKMTPLKVCETWLGKGPAKRRKMIQVTSLSRSEVEAIIVHLLLQGYLSEDFSFTPYTTYFYLKLGRKAALLQNSSHSVTMKMKRILPSCGPVGVSQGRGDSTRMQAKSKDGKRAVDSAGKSPAAKKQSTSAVEPAACENNAANTNAPLQGHNKVLKLNKDQQNQERKQEQDQTENQSTHTHLIPTQPSVLEVDVKVNIMEGNCISDGPAMPISARPFQIPPKRQSTKSPKRRKKQSAAQASDGAATAGQQRPALVSSPSVASIISDAAMEELSHLHSYYSKQLRRINYVSHEHLQEQHSGVLTCIREPFRSLRLPLGNTIARGARNLWTRVSVRRKRL
ncbi:ATP-dependent DNA helicase Q1 [Chanos chanos]|uniref:ATP-dependent DNA helicase n=1 Tax=Chanos chanos TaxID=29144 RepID=A0A6J2VY22_CHACN|nr:ATP-dependent DNA helicase Q1 [Chanos chanos]